MYTILLCGGLSFLITFFAIPVIIQVAKDKKLFDEPDERKVHKVVIPTLGGLGIFAGFVIATLLGAPMGTNELQFYIAAAIVVFFLGLKDDILILSATKKFAGQLIAAAIMIKFGGLQLNNMHGFLGIYEIPHFVSIIFTLLTIIVITNSFNLIDGVDGLAGSLGILTTSLFGAYFAYIGELSYAVIAFSLTGSLVSFLIYNFSPAKIFMGDTGSLLVGLVNAILVIKFINFSSFSGKHALAAAPAIGFAILMIPLFDTLRVFGMRILNRRSPFSPDRNHIHHFLLELGLSHQKITLACLGFNVFFVLIACFFQHLGTTLVLAILLSSGLLTTLYVITLKEKKRKKISSKELQQESDFIKTHKILSLTSDMVEVE